MFVSTETLGASVLRKRGHMQFDFVREIDLVHLVDGDLGPGESTGKWVKYDCPFCKPIRRDSKKYLLVTNGNEKLGSGFVCKFCHKKGDALAWCQQYRRMTFAQALDYLRGPYVRRRTTREALVQQAQ